MHIETSQSCWVFTATFSLSSKLVSSCSGMECSCTGRCRLRDVTGVLRGSTRSGSETERLCSSDDVVRDAWLGRELISHSVQFNSLPVEKLHKSNFTKINHVRVIMSVSEKTLKTAHKMIEFIYCNEQGNAQYITTYWQCVGVSIA